MIELNPHYAELKDSYLFRRIAAKTEAYCAAHPGPSSAWASETCPCPSRPP